MDYSIVYGFVSWYRENKRKVHADYLLEEGLLGSEKDLKTTIKGRELWFKMTPNTKRKNNNKYIKKIEG